MMELTSKEHKKLIKQIERLCEKQYRKGVQHGRLVSDHRAEHFYRSHENLLAEDRVEDYAGMLAGEAAREGMEELRSFLTKAPNDN